MQKDLGLITVAVENKASNKKPINVKTQEIEGTRVTSYAEKIDVAYEDLVNLCYGYGEVLESGDITNIHSYSTVRMQLLSSIAEEFGSMELNEENKKLNDLFLKSVNMYKESISSIHKATGILLGLKTGDNKQAEEMINKSWESVVDANDMFFEFVYEHLKYKSEICH